MKNTILLLLLFAIPLSGFGQKNSIKKFYKEYKKGKETINFVVPGFLIRLGTGLARSVVETEEEYEMLKLARKIKKARILVSEDYNPVRKSDYNKLVKNVKNLAYEDLIKIRAEETRVQIMLKENGEKIKGLLILVNEEDTFFMLHLKTKMEYKDINKVINLFGKDIPLIKETKKKRKKKKKKEKDIPVA